MLTNIRLEGFKSYRNQQLPLSPLTLMIGANASGKSNALEAFRFLCWLGQGQKLSVLRQRVDDSEQILRCQVRDLPYLRGQSFILGCETDDNEWNILSVESHYATMSCISFRKLSNRLEKKCRFIALSSPPVA
ncbi:AAA family ATPase [Pseudomonas fluorescens]|uniref:Endonuclease GajA/Old nuclease/RecF-like AAA domain-containing protein n=1 Tax=Pseudomonas fluorescens TaxID=294 RepID=A0A5E7BHV1_PSEFL|nr:AAA family ATPase [Pseudomonas fluorescens]VVN88987.1 hypothetical protein PS710_01725 [Pseudomonas fluorescens]